MLIAVMTHGAALHRPMPPRVVPDCPPDVCTPAAKELAVIQSQFPFDIPTFKPLRLTFPEGIQVTGAVGRGRRGLGVCAPVGPHGTSCTPVARAKVSQPRDCSAPWQGAHRPLHMGGMCMHAALLG